MGINDLKPQFQANAEKSTENLRKLVSMISSKTPETKIIILAPPPVPQSYRKDTAETKRIEESKKLAMFYEQLSQELKCGFLASGSVICASAKDGVHYEAEAHKKLGQAIAAKILDS